MESTHVTFKLSRFALVAVIAASSLTAWAVPLSNMMLYSVKGMGVPNSEVASGKVDWKSLNSKEHQKYNGVGRMLLKRGGGSLGLCTASLLETGGDENGPAYAITAGHCFLDTDGISTRPYQPETDFFRTSANVAVEGSLELNRFDDVDKKWTSIPLKELNYASLNAADIAVVMLGKTKKELKDMGLNFYKTSTADPTKKVGTELDSLTVPGQGVDGIAQPLLHSSCKLLDIQVRSAISFMPALIENCSMVPGGSGGPLFDHETGEILAVHSDLFDFAENQAVLLDDFTREVHRDNGGAPVQAVSACFDAQGKFDLDQPKCTLAKPCAQENHFACAQKNCERGFGRSCYETAILIDNRTVETDADKEKQRNEIKLTLEEGCKLDDSYSCMAQGLQYMEPNLDVLNAFEYLNKACKLNHPLACDYTGQLVTQLAAHGALPQQMKNLSALDYFDRACELGSAQSCIVAAEMLSKEPRNEDEKKKAVMNTAKACLNGIVPSCTQLGLSYLNGFGVTQSDEDAVQMLTYSCDHKEPMACTFLGLLYGEGGKFTPSPKKSKLFLQKACALGNLGACQK